MIRWVIKLVFELSEMLSGLPLLILLSVIAPIALLAYVWKIYPSRLMVACMVVPCLLTTALVLRQDAVPLILTFDVIIVLIAVVDLFLLPSVKDFSIERDCQRVASLGKKHRVSLMVTNSSKAASSPFGNDA